MSKRPRIVFMGSDPIALPLLDALVREAGESVELVSVFTQPDRPSGRGMKVVPNAIKQWALSNHLPVRQPERCGPGDEDYLRSEAIDLVLVMAYGQLLRPSLIGIPPRGVINFHASLLPKLRGASPIHTAIATGATETGVSLMQIVPRLDAGPVLDKEVVAIPPEAQAPEVVTAIAAACVPLIRRNLETLCHGRPRFVAQDESSVTYCRRITKDDAWLDFTVPAPALHNRVRAFQPWPGALIEIGDERLKIGRARVAEDTGARPGELVVKDNRFILQCGDAGLELLEIQRPGGRMLPADDFLRGFPVAPGTAARRHSTKPLVSTRPFPRNS